MKLISGKLNGVYLANVLPEANEQVDSVLAAIAYGSSFSNEDNDLISSCLKARWRLDIWMRYDHTVPVSISLLKRFLRHHNQNIFLKLIPDCLHSKVIWWKGYGAYIGSANLTDRAWNTNIEAGIFMSDSELESEGMTLQLDDFFERIRALDVAFPVTKEVIREMEAIERDRAGLEDNGLSRRSRPIWEGPAYIEETRSLDRKRGMFQREWEDAITSLRKIGEQIGDRRPVWMEKEVPSAWQVDQCLHAFYYNRVGDARGRPFEEYYQRNRHDPAAAMRAAIDWWLGEKIAPSDEDANLYTKAPAIRNLMKKERILNLSAEEFAIICAYTHATWDHLTKMSLATFGMVGQQHMTADERTPKFANWVLQQRNQKGWSVLELLNFVLYGGEDERLWERIYLAGRDHSYTIPHYGLNSIAEVLGWARPEVAPPRNGRTSKALRALGYDVKVY